MIQQEDSSLTRLQLVKIQYGIECFLYESSKAIFFLILSFIFSLVPEYLTSLALLYAVRPAVGGFHARTNLACFITSFFFFAAVISLSKAVSISNVSMIVIIVLSAVLAVMLAPIEHPNKPIKSDKTRKMLKLVSVLELPLLGAMCSFLPANLSDTAFITIAAIMLMAVIGYFGNKSRCQTATPRI